MTKAKKIASFRDTYSTTVEYEYRGHKYDVTYANSIHYCVTPAHIQHRDAQEKIDKMLDTPKSEMDNSTFDEQLDEVWEMLGW